jgi:hypothetical protein
MINANNNGYFLTINCNYLTGLLIGRGYGLSFA